MVGRKSEEGMCLCTMRGRGNERLACVFVGGMRAGNVCVFVREGGRSGCACLWEERGGEG